jgi:3-oxoacyl-ACP reductase-like protein
MTSVRIPEGTGSFGVPRHRWEDNIKMDFRGKGCDDMNWMVR